jgi:hypothetical protein
MLDQELVRKYLGRPRCKSDPLENCPNQFDHLTTSCGLDFRSPTDLLALPAVLIFCTDMNLILFLKILLKSSFGPK